jgi:hypothetical protein
VVNEEATSIVRTHEAAELPMVWNQSPQFAVSMDIRTDQGHLGKVS